MADLALYSPDGDLVQGRAGLELWISNGMVKACFLPDAVDDDQSLSLNDYFVRFQGTFNAVLLHVTLCMMRYHM